MPSKDITQIVIKELKSIYNSLEQIVRIYYNVDSKDEHNINFYLWATMEELMDEINILQTTKIYMPQT